MPVPPVNPEELNRICPDILAQRIAAEAKDAAMNSAYIGVLASQIQAQDETYAQQLSDRDVQIVALQRDAALKDARIAELEAQVARLENQPTTTSNPQGADDTQAGGLVRG